MMTTETYAPTRSATAEALDEARRFDVLREQDNKPLQPPPSLRGLVSQGGLSPRLVPEAEREWQAAVDALRSDRSYPADERAFFLTLLLARHYAADTRRTRELVEPVAAQVGTHRFKQYLYSILANLACREGHARRAREWLALCDPRSDDLLADSSYRTSAALLALLERDWDGAVRHLGNRADDIPIVDSHDTFAALLRSHALERRGDVEAAVEQLVHRLTVEPRARVSFERTRELYPSLRLCADSLPRALAAVPDRTGGAKPRPRSLARRMIFSIHGVVGIAFLIAAIFVDDEAKTDDGFPLRWFFVLMGAMFAGFPLLLSLIMHRLGAGRRRILRDGLEGRGEVIEARQTGMYINKQPRMAIRLRVTEGMSAPYEAEIRTVIPLHQLGQLTPGLTLRVRIDPKDRSKVVLASD